MSRRDRERRDVDRGELVDRAIRPGELEHPERDLELERPELDRGELARRIERARSLKPVGRHFRPSWRRGLEAVLEALELGRRPADVRRLEVPAGEACRACWVQGRDAAVKATE
jgi:hypothetical protein